jgi:hypothetical protein
MNANTTKNASIVGFVWRCFLAVMLAMMVLFFGFLCVFSGFMWHEAESEAYEESRCSEYYARGNYGALCEYLNRFDLVGDDYEKYSEAVEGAILKSEYLQWSEAAEQGMDGAAQKAEEILTQLQVLSEQAKYPENREIFKEFLRELQNI